MQSATITVLQGIPYGWIKFQIFGVIFIFTFSFLWWNIVCTSLMFGILK